MSGWNGKLSNFFFIGLPFRDNTNEQQKLTLQHVKAMYPQELLDFLIPKLVFSGDRKHSKH